MDIEESEYIENSSINLFFDNQENEIVLQNIDNLKIENIQLFNILGQKINQWVFLKSTYEYRLKVKKLDVLYIISIKTSKGYINKKILIK